jgi:hypothetical protein
MRNSAPKTSGREADFSPKPLVLPAHVRGQGSGGSHVSCDLGHDALIDGAEALGIGDISSTHVAMGPTGTVLEVRDAERVLRRVDKILHQVHSIVEIPGIHVAHGEVEFSREFGAEG